MDETPQRVLKLMHYRFMDARQRKPPEVSSDAQIETDALPGSAR
jgi:hypothetical protein